MNRRKEALQPGEYAVRPAPAEGGLMDLEVRIRGRWIAMLGRGGPEGERRLAGRLAKTENVLPVLLGSGLGHAAAALLEAFGEAVVVDREQAILKHTRPWASALCDSRLTWVEEIRAPEAVRRLGEIAASRPEARLVPVALPVYQRLAPEYYGVLRRVLEQGGRAPSPRPAHRRFRNRERPRILLLATDFFIYRDVQEACERLEIPARRLEIGHRPAEAFVSEARAVVQEFRPDFAFTVNHYGVDLNGKLLEMLRRERLPLASWFVDSPELVLYHYDHLAGPDVAVFTWEGSAVEGIRARGYELVHHLPLGCNTHRFKPPERIEESSPYRTRLGFVGTTWMRRQGRCLREGRFPAPLLRAYRELGRLYEARRPNWAFDLIREDFPELAAPFAGMNDLQRCQAYETLVMLEGSRIHRRRVLERFMDLAPLIVGDETWRRALRGFENSFRWLPPVDYYTELPKVYAHADVSLNISTLQLRGAVNQRVFDAPAAGGFVLTDHRDELGKLFDLEREVACYRSESEAPEMAAHYLSHPNDRARIAAAARARIAREHTYEHRVRELVQVMGQWGS